MSRIPTIVRPVGFALAFLFAVAPVTAMASETAPAKAEASRRHLGSISFPVPAKTFRELVEKRIQKAREHMNEQIAAHKLTPAQAAELRKRFDEGAKQVRAAVDTAAADGTVTKDEAEKVRDLAKDLKKQGKDKGRAERRRRAAKKAS